MAFEGSIYKQSLEARYIMALIYNCDGLSMKHKARKISNLVNSTLIINSRALRATRAYCNRYGRD
jgi:hypothetical protein